MNNNCGIWYKWEDDQATRHVVKQRQTICRNKLLPPPSYERWNTLTTQGMQMMRETSNCWSSARSGEKPRGAATNRDKSRHQWNQCNQLKLGKVIKCYTIHILKCTMLSKSVRDCWKRRDVWKHKKCDARAGISKNLELVTMRELCGTLVNCCHMLNVRKTL